MDRGRRDSDDAIIHSAICVASELWTRLKDAMLAEHVDCKYYQHLDNLNVACIHPEYVDVGLA